MAGVSAFTRAGYPTIATVGGTLIFLYTIYYSATKTGYGGWRNHGVWFFFNLWLWLFGLFLVFGPDSLAAAGGFSTLNGPRAAIIGLQLMLQASLGAFAIYSANAYASLVFALFGLFNELCLIGSNFFFNYNQPIWTLNSVQCNEYFDLACTSGYNGDYECNTFTRCHDNGYLEVLRVFGTLEIIVNGFLIVIALLAYATAVPAGAAAGYPAGVPAGGVPAGAPVAYNSGPAYNREQQQYTTGAPVVGTTQYTTTTGVPATTTTTTM